MISKYNLYYYVRDMFYIYNTASRKGISVTKQSFIALRNFKQDDIIHKDYLCLKENGMLFEKEFNELKSVLYNYYEAVYKPTMHYVIMAATGCNFQCKYCYEAFQPKIIDGEFIKTFIKHLNRNIKGVNGLYIDWFGGEPLLAVKAIIELSYKMKQICEQRKIPYVSSITTNGYLLDEKTFTSLLDSMVLYFQITIDGNEETHDKLRPLKGGMGTYNRILDNLRLIKKNTPKNRYFKIKIRNNVYEGNKDECAEFLSLFEKEFADDPRFSLIQFPIADWGGEGVKELKNQLIKHDGIKHEKNIYYDTDMFDSIESKICFAAKKNGFVIDPDLVVYKCAQLIQDVECCQKQSKVGYLDNKGNMILNQDLALQWCICDIGDSCKECTYLPYCLYQNCPANELEKRNGCCEKIQNELFQKLELSLKSEKAKKCMVIGMD